MDYKKLANLLFKDVTLTPDDIYAKFPKRNIQGKVTRLGPSPTGFIHLGNLHGSYIIPVISPLSLGYRRINPNSAQCFLSHFAASVSPKPIFKLR